jgi:hypothetical protein
MFSVEVAMGSESRQHSRMPLAMDASGFIDHADRGFLCRVVDISPGGVRLDTYSTLEKGAIVTLSLLKGLDVPARVVWANDFEVGCAFLSPLEPWTVKLITQTGGRGIYDRRQFIE